ncbi:uncharacterized protein LOC133838482 [Drosophila sulfurigaster albostrigata]|uniref:uncharacterized protein LOC133838482 n=1 Tax=Drosophila sulfurigaster albostrigata TaxID=89887 RepID=UPI002D21C3E3|nr:uncharacterized protein LOC133838482 [Drosophila sulfurigaster albostrigata]
MAALKLLFLTILTYVYVSNGIMIGMPIELTGALREAAVERLYTGLHKVSIAGGPQYKVLRVNKVTNQRIIVNAPVDTYDVDLVVGRIVKQCIVRITIHYPPTAGDNSISIICNGKLEFEMDY